MKTGDVVWVTKITPGTILLKTPALAVASSDSEMLIEVYFIDPETCDEKHRKRNPWLPDEWKPVNWDELTDEQIRLVTLWRLQHG